MRSSTDVISPQSSPLHPVTTLNRKVESIYGKLHHSHRLDLAHVRPVNRLWSILGPPLDEGIGGSGGFCILPHVELHLGGDTLCPDLAAFKCEQIETLPDTSIISVVPDWVCEVLVPSKTYLQRAQKMFIYAREGVRHLWFVHPKERIVEVYSLQFEGRWVVEGAHYDNAKVRIVPFETVEIDLSRLWGKSAQTRD